MKYVALLRAINVGGRIIKMEKLKSIFTENGYSNVSSYIQSGNILFESNVEENDLVIKTESMLEKELGYPVPVILRTKKELMQALEQNPFSAYVGKEGMNLYFGFMQKIPSPELISANTFENIIIVDRVVYVLMDKSRNQTIADKLPIQKALERMMTARNLNTVNKLIDRLS